MEKETQNDATAEKEVDLSATEDVANVQKTTAGKNQQEKTADHTETNERQERYRRRALDGTFRQYRRQDYGSKHQDPEAALTRQGE